jgi:hypothetical protein
MGAEAGTKTEWNIRRRSGGSKSLSRLDDDDEMQAAQKNGITNPLERQTSPDPAD